MIRRVVFKLYTHISAMSITYDIIYIIYISGIVYLALFIIGLRSSKPMRSKKDRKTVISVILPIYNERDDLIKICIETLLRQTPERLIVYAVVQQALNEKQIALIKAYKHSFRNLYILKQKNPSLVEACKNALQYISTEYVCVINVDVSLKPEAISKLVWFVKNEELDIGFCLLLPKYTNSFSRFTGIKKLVRQYLFQCGRGSLGMGYFIPGAFYLAKRSILELRIRNTLTDDLALMLEAYSTRKIRLDLLNLPLAYELEKKSFTAWSMQFSRWFIGNLKIYDMFIEAFGKARSKIKLGILGLLYLWYIIPVSLIFGIILVLFFRFSLMALLFFYVAITLPLFFIKEIRKINPAFVSGFWFVYSFAKVCGLVISPYTYLIYKYRSSKTNLIFKR